jgi:alginate production protein
LACGVVGRVITIENRAFRKIASGMLWIAAFAIALSWCHPGVAGGRLIDREGEGVVRASKVQHNSDRLSLFLEDEADQDLQAAKRLELAVPPDNTDAPDTAAARLPGEGATGNTIEAQEAQFQLPQPAPEGEEPAQQLPSRLVYEYGYGSESEITYRRDPDLDDRVDDDSLIATPELNAHLIYRPTDWLETGLEVILDREFPIQEEHRVVLPNGDVEVSENRQLSLEVDQLFVRVKDVTDPLEFTVGRLNFEDYRHFLYDTSLDIVQAKFKRGKYRAEASFGRENVVDPNLLQNTPQDKINTYIFNLDYRGFEDISLSGYTIVRDDKRDEEGHPWWVGLRSQGFLSHEFSYWAELATMRGEDDTKRNFAGYGLDVGGTYRFTDLPFNPNVTLGFALATGDSSPDDHNNNEFRQTGLQSNESSFAGVSEFLVYGEALDPELSNLKILTAGLGFRPSPDMSLDFVFHKYWLYNKAEELPNSGVTAVMNGESKDVGNAFDIVIGLRSLFGIRRLGMDLRTGWFFPGDAFRTAQPSGGFRDADTGVSAVIKFWW